MRTVSDAYPCQPEHLPRSILREGHYGVSFAHSAAELDAIQRLRFEVFNLELGEGFAESFATGRDADGFDPLCHHLMVTDTDSGSLVGCYRMQTPAMAAANRGFYSATLFDLSTFPAAATSQSIEVGRACVAKTHRSSLVLFLLWKGLALYVAHNHARYLFGCCSLTSQNPADGSAALRYLQEGNRMHPEWTIQPAPGAVCPVDPEVDAATGVPALFGTYLRYGAKVCGPPAIDRQFKTIDYFVVLDVDALLPRAHKMFFG